MCYNVLQHMAVGCSGLQRVAACCSVLQHDAVRNEFILLVLSFAEYCLVYKALLQNVVSLIGLFCKRDL